MLRVVQVYIKTFPGFLDMSREHKPQWFPFCSWVDLLGYLALLGLGLPGTSGGGIAAYLLEGQIEEFNQRVDFYAHPFQEGKVRS